MDPARIIESINQRTDQLQLQIKDIYNIKN